VCALLGLLSGSGQAAGVVWTGGSLVDNNWSDSPTKRPAASFKAMQNICRNIAISKI